MSFRLLECKRCGRRTWATEGDLPLIAPRLGDHFHEWLERFTFDDGQVAA